MKTTLRHLLTLGLTLVSLSSLHGQSFLTNGLVAYYPFNGSGNDLSGSGYGQVLTTTNDPSAARQGVYSSLNQFVATNYLYPIDVQFNRTVSFWLKTGNFLGTSDGRSIARLASTPLCFFSVDSSGRLLVDNNKVGIEYTTTIPANQWTLITVVSTNNDLRNLRVFVNGAVADTSGTILHALESNYGLRADNCRIWVPYFESNWSIDDYRFYTRSLSDSEVASLYSYESNPRPCSGLVRATALGQVVNGFLINATITDSGCGYTNNPLPTVTISGGGGSGAIAQAVVSNGQVTGIAILNAGSGYTSTPTITISAPPRVPKLYVNTIRVRVTMDVTPGLRYQLESSINLTTWTNVGTVFTAASEQLIQDYDVDTTSRQFRIREVP